MEKERKDLLEKLLVATGEAHRHFATSRDCFLAQFDLTRPQIELLFVLKQHRATITELAEQFSVTSSAISQTISQLEEAGYVQREYDGTDKRRAYVEISDSALPILNDIRKKFAKRLNDRFAKIETDKLRSFLEVLEKINLDVKKELHGEN